MFAIAAFHTQRPVNYSISLSGKNILATIFVTKTNQLLRLFSTSTEQCASKEDEMIKLAQDFMV